MDEKWLHEKIAEISRTIYSYCRAKTPSQQDAEDLSQDILLELMKSVDNIRNDKAFYAFMWGVAGNVYKQWCRKKQKNIACELPENIPDEEEIPDDSSSDISSTPRTDIAIRKIPQSNNLVLHRGVLLL